MEGVLTAYLRQKSEVSSCVLCAISILKTGGEDRHRNCCEVFGCPRAFKNSLLVLTHYTTMCTIQFRGKRVCSVLQRCFTFFLWWEYSFWSLSVTLA